MKRKRIARVSLFDTLANAYDAWFDEEGRAIFFIEVQALRQVLPLLPKPWLEIGVGSGRFAQALGIEIGIDPSRNLLKMAERRGIKVVHGRGEQQLFDKEVFGTVFLVVTLCFLDSPLDVLREAHRILMPEGRIVLGLVLRESPWGKLYRQKGNEGHRFYRYATFYSCDEVIRLLAKADFVTEKIISTLFQEPGKVLQGEDPIEGYFPNAGFTIIVAGKRGREITWSTSGTKTRETRSVNSGSH
jgi:SAM-dependent methyltransferase